jgi:hypothetical protein
MVAGPGAAMTTSPTNPSSVAVDGGEENVSTVAGTRLRRSVSCPEKSGDTLPSCLRASAISARRTASLAYAALRTLTL